MSTAAFNCAVQIAGTATAFTTEAMTGSGAGPYQITDTAKMVWDTDTVPDFFDNAVSINAADILSIDYLLGSVTFTGSKTGPITVTGEYFPLYTVTEAYSFTLSAAIDMLDDTVFADTARSRIPGLLDVSGSIELYNALTEDLDTTGDSRTIQATIDAGIPVVLSIRMTSDAADFYRLWALLSEVETTAAVDDLVGRMFSFELSAKEDAAGRPSSISYQES